MKNFSEVACLCEIVSIDWETAIGYSDNVKFLVENLSSLFSTIIEKMLLKDK